MNTQGIIIVWGSLVTCIAALVVGYCIQDGTLAALLRIFGILGICGWIAFAIFILNAMNTDI